VKRAIGFALAAAALFGAATPLAKLLLGTTSPLMLAGLLYLGSGLGLGAWLVLRPRRGPASPLQRADWPWLAGAVAAGGVVGPAALMLGLARSEASTASLLLNLEAVFTAALAWVVFRENVERRVFLGMLAIVAGGAVLSWAGAPRATGLGGPALIALAHCPTVCGPTSSRTDWSPAAVNDGASFTGWTVIVTVTIPESALIGTARSRGQTPLSAK